MAMATSERYQQAIAALRAQLADFRALPNRIVRLRQRAARVESAAAARNMPVEQVKAAGIRTALLTQLNTVNAVTKRLDSFLDQLRSLGLETAWAFYKPQGLGALPAIPLSIAGLAIAVAAGVGYALRAFGAQEALLDQLERGVLTAEEYATAVQGTSFLGPLRKALPYLAAGALAFVALPMLTQRLQRVR